MNKSILTIHYILILIFLLFAMYYSYYETYKILTFVCIKNKYVDSNNKKINNKASLTVKVKDALVLLKYTFHFVK